MLFGPEGGKQLRDPDMNGSQAVETGVAGSADGDEEPRLAHARLAMMNVEFSTPCPTGRAPKVIAGEDLFPVSGEVIPGVPAHPITLRTQASDGGHPFAAGAEQRLLPGTGLYLGPQKTFPAAGEG
jgi:hypothetical protein